MDKTNLQIIRESFGRVAYTHKTHEKEAELEEQKSNRIKIINVILTTLTFLSFVGGAIFPDSSWMIFGAIVISAFTLAFNLFTFSFNPSQKAEQHRYIAKELWYIREKYVNLMADIRNSSISDDKVIAERNALIRELKFVYKFAPQTTFKAYKKATGALKNKEELTFSNAEINAFLPSELHISDETHKISTDKKRMMLKDYPS